MDSKVGVPHIITELIKNNKSLPNKKKRKRDVNSVQGASANEEGSAEGLISLQAVYLWIWLWRLISEQYGIGLKQPIPG